MKNNDEKKCEICLVMNDKAAAKCESCKTAFPGAALPTTAEPAATASTTAAVAATSAPRRSIALTVDLCLFRVVSELCGCRVLPYGIRQMIKEYAFMSFTNETLREAVRIWRRNRDMAKLRYGEINDWDVSRVTNMDRLFHNARSFNDCIDRWDVGRVTSMVEMFHYAEVFNQPLASWNVCHVANMQGMFRLAQWFNQPLNTWDVSQVTDMSNMFCNASSFNQPLESWDIRQVTLYFMELYPSTSRWTHGTYIT
jgi:hypothetical protein